MIPQELIAALDDLIQTGARASATIRTAIDRLAGPRTQERGQVEAARAALAEAQAAQRTEQSMPAIITTVRDVVATLGELAGHVGESNLAAALKAKVQRFTQLMRAAGLGTPWLTILGIGAGAIAVYYLWRHYSKTTLEDRYQYPEPEPVGPRLRGLGKSLGAFRGPKRCSLAGAPKYEFEPEVRLEGHHRGGFGRRHIRSKR